MKTSRLLISLVIFTIASFSAKADVLILVHGYMGSAFSWEASGVNALLEANGWRRSGVLAGPQMLAGGGVSKNSSYSVELPSLAPMMVQADHLQAMLQQINATHPGEPVIVAAHSAGGVVARLVLARGGVPRAKALITVASPHLGTARAVQALDATDTSWPFSMIKEFFSSNYRVLRSSRGALLDLTPAFPGNLLHWLNGLQHPDIEYYSIVTLGPVGLGDELVPAFSQDMNNVPVLKGRSKLVAVAGGHFLNPQVGFALNGILAQMK